MLLGYWNSAPQRIKGSVSKSCFGKRKTEVWYQLESNLISHKIFLKLLKVSETTLQDRLEPRQLWIKGRQDHILTRTFYLCIPFNLYWTVNILSTPQMTDMGVIGSIFFNFSFSLMLSQWINPLCLSLLPIPLIGELRTAGWAYLFGAARVNCFTLKTLVAVTLTKIYLVGRHGRITSLQSI